MENKKLKIQYIGPILDPSGYASATRKAIVALHEYGHEISAIHHDFDKHQRPLLGKEGDIIAPLLNKSINPDAYILEMTPDVLLSYYSKLFSCRIPVVVWFYWETTLIPDEWINCLNACAHIIVPCEFQKTVCIKCGITKPISVIGSSVDVDAYKDVKQRRASNGKYTFYSIFQWTERKNPAGLLRIFWHAFFGITDVRLIIKTYLANHSQSEIDKITAHYNQIAANMPLAKDVFRLDQYPEVKLVTDMLSDEEMQQLHADGDCFILLHRGEGFGLPIIEAMASGNPVIATNFYACEDYLTKYNSMPVSYQLEPVFNMPWIHWYRGIQMWASPNLQEAGNYMMWAYKNHKASIEMGHNAQQTVSDKYNPNIIAQKITDVLHKTIKKKF